MFSKGRDGPGPGHNTAAATKAPGKPAAKAGQVPSIVSPDLTITGNLESQGDVHVDGRVLGDVAAQTLTIGEQGSVHGAIRAETVKVCGAVVGEIEAGTVTLVASARVEGDVVHDSLAIEPGANLEGHCRRRGRDKPAASGAAKAKRRPDTTAAADPAATEPAPTKPGTAGEAGSPEPKRRGNGRDAATS